MSARKNKSFNALPQFIWGKAHDSRHFLTHTRSPRFVCLIDRSNQEQAHDQSETGEIARDHLGGLTYHCSMGVSFSSFAFIDGVPSDEELQSACDAAVGELPPQ